MAVNTTREIVESYQNLLIMQYLNKPKASGFIEAIVAPSVIPQTSTQEITFSTPPTSGTFSLSYDEETTALINWNDTATIIQGYLQALTGLESVTVTGSIATSLVVTFTDVPPPALSLEVVTNLLFASSSVTITITETDQTIPLAVTNGFNFGAIAGDGYASGNQLDVIGQYVGVSRTGLGFSGTATITLDDTDYISLIKMGIIKNSSGSSLSQIMGLLFQFFPHQIFLYDHADMTMTYVISTSVGSQDLIQLFVTEGLLPTPMAVGVTTLYPPTADLFSFRTYAHASVTGKPFNTYSDYNLTWSWLSYQALIIP